MRAILEEQKKSASNNIIAPENAKTLQLLGDKHPSAAPPNVPAVTGNGDALYASTSEEETLRVSVIFTLGSAGGPLACVPKF